MSATRTCLLWLAMGSSAAFAGGPLSFDLQAPAAVYRGVSATFQVSGGPATGGAGLFVAPFQSSQPVVCPAPLMGDCLDLQGPAYLVATTGLQATGPRRLVVTPPTQPYVPKVRLQAAAVGDGQNWLSNEVVVDVVDTCLPPIASSPAHHASGVAVDGSLSFTFSNSAAAHYQYALYRGASRVPASVAASGSVAIVTPHADLAPGTAYTLYTRTLCGDVMGVPFTTAAATGPATYVGNTWTLRTTNAFVSQPSNLSAWVDVNALFDALDGTVAYQAINWSQAASAFALRQGLLVQGTNVQDTCEPTTHVSAELSNNTSLSIAVADWSGTGQPAQIGGTLSPNGASWSGVTVDVAVPKSVLNQMSAGSGDIACGVLGWCDPCPSGSGQCLLLELGGLTAASVDTDLVVVSTPGPGCP